ncbi:hypothetical protein Mal64_25130 [Pseudobythopirellula maris]|uniref:Uncharacterized protein n=1 Tax=Pseudobythopirellula maris TaxID=2527991 RepID=A0A5C5ZNF8_9BACT|nr:hypothetical protein Mal64_25130 [Pseudobythopirellula maris]
MTQPYRRYRAPRVDNAALVEPDWSGLLEAIDLQHTAPPRSDVAFFGEPLQRVAVEARGDLIEAAERFTSQYADLAKRADPRGPIVLSGHQPELFHNGVWFKNWALARLGRDTGAAAVHLLIDSDLCREPSVRVPAGPYEAPRGEAIDYDALAASVPHEERPIVDRERFGSFAQRVASSVAPWIERPLALDVWRDATEAADAGQPLGEALSRARHRFERGEGSPSLELPISQICDTRPFRLFLLELIGRAERTRKAYNAALDEYRQAHRVRSAAQPLPDLQADGDRVETPFWVWRTDDPTRRPLFVTHRDGELLLDNGATGAAAWSAAIDAPEGEGVELALARLGSLRERGVKLRSRALMTTLYGRLVLSDLFLHGIGGAKYDEVTDHMAERLFGSPPPPHAVLTATLRLPLGLEATDADEPRRLTQERRELRYHPERALGPAAKGLPERAAALLAKKRRWIAEGAEGAELAERHRDIEAANAALRPFVEGRAEEIDRGLQSLAERRVTDALLRSREHAFVLFSADDIRRRLLPLAGWR